MTRRIADDSGLGLLVAIVGSDGAGKSTVAEALIAWLGESGPSAMCHLGKQTGDYRRKLMRLPLVGAPMGRSIRRGGRRVTRARGPDAITAVLTYLISMRRLRRFRRMMALRRRGVAIVADRYPQLAVPGPKMDGPHLPTDTADPIARLLGRREQDRYRWMASFLPDVVLRLNVDLATAAARKPDHSYEGLERKIELTRSLSYNGAPIVDIDTTQPLETVLLQARQAVADALAGRRARTPEAISSQALASAPRAWTAMASS